MSGYRPCACRDCFEIAIGEPGVLCHACRDAGCEPCDCIDSEGYWDEGTLHRCPHGECRSPDAYGSDLAEEESHHH